MDIDLDISELKPWIKHIVDGKPLSFEPEDDDEDDDE
jgi:hypothetical protein